jgi:hypothetical protein
VAARYLVAVFAFMAAATWVGVSLTSGFTCLLIFVLAFQVTRLYQRRSDSRSRGSRAKRERAVQHEPDWAEERIESASPARRDRSRPAGRVYDGDREELGWPVAREATW